MVDENLHKIWEDILSQEGLTVKEGATEEEANPDFNLEKKVENPPYDISTEEILAYRFKTLYSCGCTVKKIVNYGILAISADLVPRSEKKDFYNELEDDGYNVKTTARVSSIAEMVLGVPLFLFSRLDNDPVVVQLMFGYMALDGIIRALYTEKSKNLKQKGSLGSIAFEIPVGICNYIKKTATKIKNEAIKDKYQLYSGSGGGRANNM